MNVNIQDFQNKNDPHGVCMFTFISSLSLSEPQYTSVTAVKASMWHWENHSDILSVCHAEYRDCKH